MSSLYLVDTSVWSRHARPAAVDRLSGLLSAGLVATCAIQLTGTLRTAQNRAAVVAVQNADRGLHWLHTPDEVWDRVLAVQSELSTTGRRTAVKVPEHLILAAVAEHHQAVVLHYDRDFDTIAEITAQPVEWVVPPGSVD